MEKIGIKTVGDTFAMELLTLESHFDRLKTKEFSSLTRSFTPPAPPSSCEEFTEIGLQLRERVGLGRQQLYRLVGLGLSNFRVEEEVPSANESLISLVQWSQTPWNGDLELSQPDHFDKPTCVEAVSTLPLLPI